jgi:16S rRNA (cytosine967-C5)-methyltransferase
VSGSAARRVAIDALVRIETEGAYANLLLPRLLGTTDLAERDRAFTTNLVYGTLRMRRACDWLVDRYLNRDVDPLVRAALRVGAFQLAFLDTPPHAAVSETVGAVPKKVRGFVNAVLRRVASGDRDWPDDATRLSYPDWIVQRVRADLGPVDGLAALEAMNEPASVTEREDGYVQDRGSQLVTEAVGARPGDLVVDLCAAPGGKATGLASEGVRVVALDARPARARLVAGNAARLGLPVPVGVADGRRPPVRPGAVDRVLVDAPCSGLGALRRRPDARWRIEEAAVDRLAALQVELLDGAAEVVAPGGTLVFSVCTLTAAESTAVADRFAATHPGFTPVPGPGEPWTGWGSGSLLLPQAAGTDGMALFRWRKQP